MASETLQNYEGDTKEFDQTDGISQSNNTITQNLNVGLLQLGHVSFSAPNSPSTDIQLSDSVSKPSKPRQLYIVKYPNEPTPIINFITPNMINQYPNQHIIYPKTQLTISESLSSLQFNGCPNPDDQHPKISKTIKKKKQKKNNLKSSSKTSNPSWISNDKKHGNNNNPTNRKKRKKKKKPARARSKSPYTAISEEVLSALNALQINFKEDVGHVPHTMEQMLVYCKQKELPYKFSEVKCWWPQRSNPTKKPKQSAMNAADYIFESELYDDEFKYETLDLLCHGYIRLSIEPLVRSTTIIPMDIIYTVFKYLSSHNLKKIFITQERSNNIDMICMDKENKVRKLRNAAWTVGLDSELNPRDCSISHADNVEILYPSTIDIYKEIAMLQIVDENEIIQETKLNAIFKCGGTYRGHFGGRKYSKRVSMLLYQEGDTNLYSTSLPDLPISSICSSIYHHKYGLIIACDGDISNFGWAYVADNCVKSVEEIRTQRYYRLTYNKTAKSFKWLEIKNRLNLKGNSAICMIGNDELFVCGHSGVGVYNFTDFQWRRMAKMRFAKYQSKPYVCYDEYKKRIYALVRPGNNLVDIYYFDLMDNEWHHHSHFFHHASKLLMWLDNDAVLRIMCNFEVYEYDKYRNLWILNKIKTQSLESLSIDRNYYHAIHYLFI